MPKLKLIYIAVLVVALSACGKSSNNGSGTVVIGAGVPGTSIGFPASCPGLILPTLSPTGSSICEVNDAELGSFTWLGIGIGTSPYLAVTPISVHAGDTIKVANPKGPISFFVAGVPVVPTLIGSSIVFQAPAAGYIQYEYDQFQNAGFDGILVQSCYDQNNVVYACP